MEHDDKSSASGKSAVQGALSILDEIKTKSSDTERIVFGLGWNLKTCDVENKQNLVAVLFFVANFLQLLSFIFSVDTWIADNPGFQTFLDVARYFRLQFLLAKAPFSAYLGVFLGLFSLTVVCIGGAFYLSWLFRGDVIAFRWPLLFSRTFILISGKILFITSLGLAFSMLDCGNGVNQNIQTADLGQCASSGGVRIILAVVGAICGVGLIISAFLAVCFFVEVNPRSIDMLASANAPFFIGEVFLIALLTLFSVVIPNGSIAWPILQVILFFFLWRNLSTLPYFNPWTNKIQSGLYCALFGASIVCLIGKIVVLSKAGSDNLADIRRIITIVVFLQMPLTAVVGVLSSHLRLLHLHGARVHRRIASEEDKKQMNHRTNGAVMFTHPHEFEIATRHVYQQEHGDAEVAESVLLSGIAAMPNCVWLQVIYCTFLTEIRHNVTRADTVLKDAKSKPAGLLDRYMLFIQNQISQERLSKSEGDESSVDNALKASVRFNSILASLDQFESLERSFFKLLSQRNVQLSQLRRIMSILSALRRQLDSSVHDLLKGYKRSVPMLRLYGRYMNVVRTDAHMASAFFSEADTIEAEIQRDRYQRSLFEVKLHEVDDAIDRVITIDRFGMIQRCTTRLANMFGFATPSLLLGRNVANIAPPPHNIHHDLYLKKYHDGTKKISVLNQERMIVGQHLDGHTFPVKIFVTTIVQKANSTEAFSGRLLPLGKNEPMLEELMMEPPSFATNFDGEIFSFNQKAMDMFQTNPAGLKDYSLFSMMSDFPMESILELPDEVITTLTFHYVTVPRVKVTMQLLGGANNRTLICQLQKLAEVPAPLTLAPFISEAELVEGEEMGTPRDDDGQEHEDDGSEYEKQLEQMEAEYPDSASTDEVAAHHDLGHAPELNSGGTNNEKPIANKSPDNIVVPLRSSLSGINRNRSGLGGNNTGTSTPNERLLLNVASVGNIRSPMTIDSQKQVKFGENQEFEASSTQSEIKVYNNFDFGGGGGDNEDSASDDNPHEQNEEFKRARKRAALMTIFTRGRFHRFVEITVNWIRLSFLICIIFHFACFGGLWSKIQDFVNKLHLVQNLADMEKQTMLAVLYARIARSGSPAIDGTSAMNTMLQNAISVRESAMTFAQSSVAADSLKTYTVNVWSLSGVGQLVSDNVRLIDLIQQFASSAVALTNSSVKQQAPTNEWLYIMLNGPTALFSGIRDIQQSQLDDINVTFSFRVALIIGLWVTEIIVMVLVIIFGFAPMSHRVSAIRGMMIRILMAVPRSTCRALSKAERVLQDWSSHQQQQAQTVREEEVEDGEDNNSDSDGSVDNTLQFVLPAVGSNAPGAGVRSGQQSFTGIHLDEINGKGARTRGGFNSGGHLNRNAKKKPTRTWASIWKSIQQSIEPKKVEVVRGKETIRLDASFEDRYYVMLLILAIICVASVTYIIFVTSVASIKQTQTICNQLSDLISYNYRALFYTHEMTGGWMLYNDLVTQRSAAIDLIQSTLINLDQSATPDVQYLLSSQTCFSATACSDKALVVGLEALQLYWLQKNKQLVETLSAYNGTGLSGNATTYRPMPVNFDQGPFVFVDGVSQLQYGYSTSLSSLQQSLETSSSATVAHSITLIVLVVIVLFLELQYLRRVKMEIQVDFEETAFLLAAIPEYVGIARICENERKKLSNDLAKKKKAPPPKQPEAVPNPTTFR